jgi:hypothetical protein
MLPKVMPRQSMNTDLKMEWWWQRWRADVPVIHLGRIEEKLIKLVFKK